MRAGNEFRGDQSEQHAKKDLDLVWMHFPRWFNLVRAALGRKVRPQFGNPILATIPKFASPP